MFLKRNSAKQSKKDRHPFPVEQQPVLLTVKSKAFDWIKDSLPLFEAFCVALSFHVLSFPFLWFVGWALPWPKSPGFTTIIEIDLENWPNEAVPRKVKQLLNLKK